MPIYMMNICAKFYRKTSTNYRDIALREIGEFSTASYNFMQKSACNTEISTKVTGSYFLRSHCIAVFCKILQINTQLESVAIAMHCNLKATGLIPQILGPFNALFCSTAGFVCIYSQNMVINSSPAAINRHY